MNRNNLLPPNCTLSGRSGIKNYSSLAAEPGAKEGREGRLEGASPVFLESHEPEEISRILREEDKWTVVGHCIPDGDCVGAVNALTLVLKGMGKQVTALIPDGVPQTYGFLSGTDNIASVSEITTIFPSIIYLDCSDPERVGEAAKACLADKNPVINIDHHISNRYFGQLNLVDAEASSTCEVLYQLFEYLNLALTPAIATSLYCGIIMDTGNFQYSATRPQTHRVAARLLESGVDLNQVRIKLFESKSRAEMYVLQAALASLAFSEDGRVAWMQLRYEELEQMGALDQHFEGIINFARSVEGVEAALLFREIDPGKVKIGFRSKGIIDVNQLASIWGGGGHRMAAGAQMEGPLEFVANQVITMVKDKLA